jgi:hypothetical protein
MPRIVDEFHEAFGRKLVSQPLHPLAAGRPHLGDPGDAEGANQRQAAHETERTAAPGCDEPSSLTDGPYSKEELGHFEHQARDRLALPRGHLIRRSSPSCRLHGILLHCRILTPKLSISKMTPLLSIQGRS